MAKKVQAYVKLQVAAGMANPSPPVGPALGQQGVNIMEFCKAFNAKTDSIEKGLPIPVVITVYADRSFDFRYQDSAGSSSAEKTRLVSSLVPVSRTKTKWVKFPALSCRKSRRPKLPT